MPVLVLYSVLGATHPKTGFEAKTWIWVVISPPSVGYGRCSPLTPPPPWLQSANDIAGPGPPVGPDRYVRKVHPPKSPRIWWPARQAPPCCAGPHHPRAALSPCRGLAVGGGTWTRKGFAAGMCCGLGCCRGKCIAPGILPRERLTFLQLSPFPQMDVGGDPPPPELRDLDSVASVRAFFQGSPTRADMATAAGYPVSGSGCQGR